MYRNIGTDSEAFYQKLLSIICCMAIGEYYINYFFGVVFNRVGLKGTIMGRILFYTIFCLLIIISIEYIINKLIILKAVDVVIITFFFIFAVVIMYFFYPENIMNVKDQSSIIELFLYFLPIYISVRVIDNNEILNDYLIKVSYFLLIWCLILQYTQYVRNYNSLDGYDGLIGYQVALSSMIIFKRFNKNKKYIHLIVSIIGAIFTLSFGNRGSFLSIIIFLMLFLFFSKIIYGTQKIKLFFIVIFSGTLYLYNIYLVVFANILYNFALKFNIQSRSLFLLTSNTDELTSDSGRSQFYNYALTQLNDHQLTGFGIYGDRQFANGYYIHNFFIEILLQYGYILGSALIILVVLLIIRGLMNKKWRDEIIVFVSFIMTYLFFSGSYLLVGSFWVMLGMVLKAKKKGLDKYENSNYLC